MNYKIGMRLAFSPQKMALTQQYSKTIKTWAYIYIRIKRLPKSYHFHINQKKGCVSIAEPFFCICSPVRGLNSKLPPFCVG